MAHASDSEHSELELSCQSSDFDEDEEANDEGVSIMPYQFEPYASGSEDDQNESDQRNERDDQNMQERLQNLSWCSCDRCIIMPTARESLCCKEVERVLAVMSDAPTQPCACITNHPGFQTVCLDPYVLDVAYFQYRQQYGERPEQANERKRYTAYRQFVRWCWEYLGKEVRVIIPSCVVAAIRTAYPDQNQNYRGFHQADSDSD